MKTTVLQENFAKALSSASRFSNTRAQLPILGNLLLKASKTKLTIGATNLEISTSVSIGAQTEKEGEITIPGRIISEIINNLSSGNISLESEKEQLKIKTESFSSMVLGMDSSDFPEIPHKIDSKKAITLSQEEFSSSLSSVIFASSTDETRPTLTGVLLIFEKKSLILVATDGFRLSQNKIVLEKEQKAQKVILPKGVLQEILRISQGGQIDILFNQTEKQAVFGVNETVLSSRMIEGEFPNFEKIIPKNSSTKITLDKDDFSRGVKLASVFARESANIVKIITQKDGIKISAEASSAGNQETTIEAKIEGEVVEIAFNFRFLEELVHSIVSEEIVISLSDPSSPAVFTDPKNPNFLHLIMPVRTQG